MSPVETAQLTTGLYIVPAPDRGKRDPDVCPVCNRKKGDACQIIEAWFADGQLILSVACHRGPDGWEV